MDQMYLTINCLEGPHCIVGDLCLFIVSPIIPYWAQSGPQR